MEVLYLVRFAQVGFWCTSSWGRLLLEHMQGFEMSRCPRLASKKREKTCHLQATNTHATCQFDRHVLLIFFF